LDDLFSIRRVYCNGRIYAAHLIEMCDDPDRDPPIFFQKNSNNIDQSGSFSYPTKTDDVDYKLEMIVALKSGGKNIATDSALDHVFGYLVGLCETRRDLQAQIKKWVAPGTSAKCLRRPRRWGRSFMLPELVTQQMARLN
jgi:fumarylpyruvate hydrolase